ncbi:sensor histidine kinase [Cryptosporangium arvum]|uniref:sensor histidine kinase n=1 Tax=Cryptosporangium arvum TaxID=80871 RepID=UPI0004B18645|nr:histidine kinase [Cryptosporangium arvum]
MRAGQSDETPTLRRQSMLVAVGCVIGDGAPFLLQASQWPGHPLIWLAGAAIVLADLALALPARTAGPVAVVHAVVRVGVAVALLVATGDHDSIGNAAGLFLSAYRAGAWVGGRGAWAALGALVVGMFATQVLQGYEETAPNILLTFTNTVLPWTLGRHTTGRSGYIEQVRRRAEEQQRAAALAVEAERVSVARDLHDTISHHVSAVGVHAAAARLGMASGSPKVTASLEQVEASSRAALADLRRMLDLLHGNESDGVRQPGLNALDDLVEGSRRAGLAVNLEVTDLAPQRLPGSLNLATYRVVQEILTNALRHGDGTLDLAVTQTDAALTVTATNPVGRSGRAGTGRGVDGIHHRVDLFGGTARIGAADGIWRTHLTLPIKEST